MNLKTSNGLSANKIGSNYKLVKGFHAASLEHDKLFNALLISISGLVITFLVHGLELPHALFDLF